MLLLVRPSMTFIQTIVDAQRAAAWAEGSEVEQSVVKDHHQGSIDSNISGNWGPIVLWRDQAGCFAVSWTTSRQIKTRSPLQESAEKPTVLDLLGIHVVFLDVAHTPVCQTAGILDELTVTSGWPTKTKILKFQGVAQKKQQQQKISTWLDKRNFLAMEWMVRDNFKIVLRLIWSLLHSRFAKGLEFFSIWYLLTTITVQYLYQWTMN